MYQHRLSEPVLGKRIARIIWERRNPYRELALALGATNLTKTIRRIQQAEEGLFTEEFIQRLMPLLGLTADDREACYAEEKRLHEEWVRTRPPFKPLVIRRLLAAVYQRVPVPPELTTDEERISFAQKKCEGRFRCTLQLDYERAIWFDEQGTIIGRSNEPTPLPTAKPDAGLLFS